MSAGLLFLPAVVVAGFALRFATAALERLIALPVEPLPLVTNVDHRVSAAEPASTPAAPPNIP